MKQAYVTLVAWLVALSVSAADDFSLTVKFGLGGFLRAGCATPMRVELRSNTTDAKGLLALTRQYQGGATRRFEVPVAVPGGSVVTKTLVVPTGTSGYGYAPPLVTFEPERGKVVEQRAATGGPLGDKRLIVVIGQRGSLAALGGAVAAPWGLPPWPSPSSGGTVGGTAAAGGSAGGLLRFPKVGGMRGPVDTQLVALVPEQTPADWQGYEAADCLVLPGSSLPKLSVGQRDAVAKWTAAGGYLVVTGGTATAVGHDPHLAPVLPCRVGGLTSLPHLRALNAKYARRARLQNIPVLQAHPDGGTVLLKEGTHPLILAGSHGLGTVVFLAFDPLSQPFRAWPGAEALWTDVLQLKQPRALLVASPSETAKAVGETLKETARGRSASLSSVLAFLSAYFLLAVPINRVVLRRLGKMELSWVTIPAIAVLFACGSYVFARGLKGQDVILGRTSLVFTGQRTSNALTVEGFSLFSPALRSYDVTLPDGVRAVADVTDTGRRYDSEWRKRFSLILRPVDPPMLRDTAVGMWASRKFAFCQVSPRSRGLRCTLTAFKRDELTGTMRNDTARPLRGCGFYFGGGFTSVEPLNPGQSAEFRVPVSSSTRGALSGNMSGLPDGFDQVLGLSTARRRTDQSDYYRGGSASRGGALSWTDGAWAVGHSDQPNAPLQIAKHDCQEETATLFAARPNMLLADGHVVVPPDACALSIVEAPPGTSANWEGRLNMRRGRCGFSFSPPIHVRDSAWSRAVLELFAQPQGSPPPHLTISGYDHRQRKWVPAGKAYPVAGHWRASVESPAKFVDPNTHNVVLAASWPAQTFFRTARLTLIGKP